MPLLDAIRALSEFDPPGEFPKADLAVLAEVLEAHGLAPVASYHLENFPIGAGLPAQFREKLLTLYQGVVNDNVFRFMAVRSAIKDSPVPVVLLSGLAAVDWLYPHLAFRPLGDLRLAVRGPDGARFAETVAGAGFVLAGEPVEGVARFSDGRISFTIQEGVFAGAAEDPVLFENAARVPAYGKNVFRPSPEDAILATVGEQAETGLYAPLISFVDLRELASLAPPPLARVLMERARGLGLSRALFGSMELLAGYFPRVAAAARALRPGLSAAEQAAVQAIVESARDPAKLAHLRGVEAAARLVVAPRPG